MPRPLSEGAWRDAVVARLVAAESVDEILSVSVELAVPELATGCALIDRAEGDSPRVRTAGDVSLLAPAIRAVSEGDTDLAALGADARRLADGDVSLALVFHGDAPLAHRRAELVGLVGVALGQARRRSGVSVDASRAATAQLFGELIAKASHELRTPLMSILGWTGLLQSGRLDAAKTARAFEAIDRNAREQARLVTSLLDMGRAIAGRLEVEREPVALRPLVEQAIENVRGVLRKGVEVTVRCEEVSTVADGERVRQGVEAMLTAALKSLATGTVLVELRVEGGDAVIDVTARTASGEVPSVPSGPSLGLEIASRLFAAHDGAAGVLPSGTIRARMPLREG
ncbi:MAG: HAMP domain-containing sensor histidine kinase [Polyangiales bacterium]